MGTGIQRAEEGFEKDWSEGEEPRIGPDKLPEFIASGSTVLG